MDTGDGSRKKLGKMFKIWLRQILNIFPSFFLDPSPVSIMYPCPMNPPIDPVSSRYPSPVSCLDYASICDQPSFVAHLDLEARLPFAGPGICGVGLRRTCSKEAEQDPLERTCAPEPTLRQTWTGKHLRGSLHQQRVAHQVGHGKFICSLV